jgi:hypothetical protein
LPIASVEPRWACTTAIGSILDHGPPPGDAGREVTPCP